MKAAVGCYPTAARLHSEPDRVSSESIDPSDGSRQTNASVVNDYGIPVEAVIGRMKESAIRPAYPDVHSVSGQCIKAGVIAYVNGLPRLAAVIGFLYRSV
jgi:hypothetical protein